MDFGGANEFISFDEDKFEFNVEGIDLTNDFAGRYLLVMTVETNSGSEQVLYQGVYATAQTDDDINITLEDETAETEELQSQVETE